MPQQTSASDFTNYKKLVANLQSATNSAKPNIQLAVPVSPSLNGPINFALFLPTQSATIKHAVNPKPITWHR